MSEGFEFLRKHLALPFPSDHVIVRTFVGKRYRRSRQSESVTLRMVASLELFSADAQHPVVARAIAGAMVVMALGCCRFAQFQRSGTFLPSTNVEDGTAGFYVATCLKDKDPSFVYSTHWFFPCTGVSGNSDWSTAWRDSVASCPAAISGYFMLRDFSSPGDDPLHRSAIFCDTPLLDNTRANVTFRAVLRAACGLSEEDAGRFGTSSFRHFLPNIARASFEPATVKAELGRWAGSIVKTISPSDPYAHVVEGRAASLVEMPHRYGSASGPAVICKMISRQVRTCVAVLHDHPIDTLPLLGGWGLFGDGREVDETLLL